MNDLPLISVIMAVHHGEDYIEETIQSILNQTYTNFEFIIVANCSNDETIKQVHQFHDKRIKLYKTTICQLNFNLNYALSQATGEYIVRIDADDIAVPERFFKQVAYIAMYDVVGSNVDYIDEHSNIIGFKNYPQKNENIRKNIYYKSVLAHPSVMYKKDVILKNSGYMGGKVSEDYDLWIRLMRDKSIQFYNIQENLTQYRIHPAQARGNNYAYAEIAGYFLREALHFKSFKALIGCFVYIAKVFFK
jgi:glycosyltransferase involved in cell wall biosynthesis